MTTTISLDDKTKPQVVDSTISDIEAIMKVIDLTWLKTYPVNTTHKGNNLIVTKEDILLKQSKMVFEKRYQYMKESLHNPEHKNLVIKQDNVVVGMCRATLKHLDHRINALYVLPQMQHLGFGTALIISALECLGLSEDIYLNVASYNLKSIEFYKKFGFVLNREIEIEDRFRFESGSFIPESEMIKKHKP